MREMSLMSLPTTLARILLAKQFVLEIFGVCADEHRGRQQDCSARICDVRRFIDRNPSLACRTAGQLCRLLSRLSAHAATSFAAV